MSGGGDAIFRWKSTIFWDWPRTETSVVCGLLPAGNQEIAMLTRSALQIMVNLATQIEVPEAHMADGLTLPSMVSRETVESKQRLIAIKSDIDKPEHAFAAVKYEDHWFWIYNRDFRAKRVFDSLMILLSLTETGGKGGLPLVTIPAG